MGFAEPCGRNIDLASDNLVFVLYSVVLLNSVNTQFVKSQKSHFYVFIASILDSKIECLNIFNVAFTSNN
jgi:hypothetical protein